MALRESLKSRLSRARCVFFDCDGVIFDSNGFKLKVMLQVLEGYPEAQRRRMTQYWKDNGGMSRRAKFEYFFQELAPAEDAHQLIEKAVTRFHELAVQGYQELKPLSGALQLARHVGSARSFVVSGADQEELRGVFRSKAIAGLFADILGSPTPKLELVCEVMRNMKVGPRESLLIGDGSRDFAVCRELDIHFVYLAEFSDWEGASAAMRGIANVTEAPHWPWLLEAFGCTA